MTRTTTQHIANAIMAGLEEISTDPAKEAAELAHNLLDMVMALSMKDDGPITTKRAAVLDDLADALEHRCEKRQAEREAQK